MLPKNERTGGNTHTTGPFWGVAIKKKHTARRSPKKGPVSAELARAYNTDLWRLQEKGTVSLRLRKRGPLPQCSYHGRFFLNTLTTVPFLAARIQKFRKCTPEKTMCMTRD